MDSLEQLPIIGILCLLGLDCLQHLLGHLRDVHELRVSQFQPCDAPPARFSPSAQPLFNGHMIPLSSSSSDCPNRTDCGPTRCLFSQAR